MQKEPEKTLGNYNEIETDYPPTYPSRGTIEIQAEDGQEEYYFGIVDEGIELTNNKVRDIIGDSSRLTDIDSFPKIRFLEQPIQEFDYVAYFHSGKNEIVFSMDKIEDAPDTIMKIFIHEYLHFLSHNGRDDYEQISDASPIATQNNVGFHRDFGLDIRENREGEVTRYYFLAFNEAVTEQLAIDIMPGLFETYGEYRGLLRQVIADAVLTEIGSKSENGEFTAWGEEDIKNYIYACFFRGDLSGFTNLLQTIYQEFDISEQQFGLMTSRDDLPTVIQSQIIDDDPKGPPPSLKRIRMKVQERINGKTERDYATDIVENDPDDKYGKEYDEFIKENGITTQEKQIIHGREYEIDSYGYVIYRGEEAEFIIGKIKAELDNLLGELDSGRVDEVQISEHIDILLFDKYSTSMLSDGFRDFYIYKHAKLQD